MRTMALAWCVALGVTNLVWAEPKPEAKNLLKPTNQAASWRFEEHEGGKGSLKAEGEAIAFTITEIDGTDWHVQAIQTGLDLREGAQYALRFSIKASEARSVAVAAMIDEDDWHTIGLAEQIFIDREYKEQEFVFTAENVAAKKNRISLMLGETKGTVTIKGLSLVAK